MSCKKIILLILVVLTTTGFTKPDEFEFGQMADNGRSTIVSFFYLALIIMSLIGLYKVITALLEMSRKTSDKTDKPSETFRKLVIGTLLFSVTALILAVNLTADLDVTQQASSLILTEG